jgi:2-methylcitrate dehydratase
MKNGTTIADEINVADAHPSGKKPFKRDQYIEKFKTLTDGVISKTESVKFLKLVQNLKKLNSKDLKNLNPEIANKNKMKKSGNGIFN